MSLQTMGMSKITLKQLFSFGLTLIALVALATAVILFAEQYTLKDGKLIQTGMIEIKDARDAKVFLDDEEKGSSPIALTYLEGGEYTVKLTRNDARDWSRKIKVTAGKVVTLFPIMVPGNLQAEELFATVATYSTESPLTYLTVTEEGDRLLLKTQTIEKRLFDTAVTSTILADLKNLPQNEISVETTSNSGLVSTLLSALTIYPSPTGQRAVIANKPADKYYLADESKQNPSNISAWISMPVDELYFSSDENTAIVLSSSLMIAVNLKNGHNILLNNAGEDSYTAVAPLKNRLLFGLQESQTDAVSLIQVDLDGGNRLELTPPINGWSEITHITEMEDKGILLVETAKGIYQITSAGAEPQLLDEDGTILGVDTEDQLVAVCDKIYHFSQVTLYPFTETEYPASCDQIQHVGFVNEGQNLLIELKDGSLYFTTEEGANAVKINDSIKEEDQGKPLTLLGVSYHRQYLLIHFSANMDKMYRIAIEN